MNVWKQIDELKAEHDREFARTSTALEGFSAIKGSLSTDEFGRWTCRYIPKGERKQKTLTSRDGGGARRTAEGHPREGSR